MQVENVKYSNYQQRKGMTNEQAKWVVDQVNYVRDAADPELTKEQNFKYFEQRFREAFSIPPPEVKLDKDEELKNLSVGETKYNRASRLSQVISSQVGTIDHLQRMTLMLEKRRDSLLRDLGRRQATRRENLAARVHTAEPVTDLQAEVRG